MQIPPPPLFIVPNPLPPTPQLILIDRQPLQSDRPSRMDFIRAYPHLRPKTIAHPVGEPRGGVPVDAGAVDGGHEGFGGGGRGGDDAVGVVGGVGVDVGDCVGEAGV